MPGVWCALLAVYCLTAVFAQPPAGNQQPEQVVVHEAQLEEALDELRGELKAQFEDLEADIADLQDFADYMEEDIAELQDGLDEIDARLTAAEALPLPVLVALLGDREASTQPAAREQLRQLAEAIERAATALTAMEGVDGPRVPPHETLSSALLAACQYLADTKSDRDDLETQWEIRRALTGLRRLCYQ